MAIDVETKDCTALSDAELGEMGDICTGGSAGFDFGLLSKQREEWVLITLARSEGKLHGFSFCTLERIGGTPSVLIGLASVKRTSKRDAVLKAVMHDQFRRAVLAFPDEDVLVGTRFASPSGFEAFKSMKEINPRPGHKANGEERGLGPPPREALRGRGHLRRARLLGEGQRRRRPCARPRVAEARGDPC